MTPLERAARALHSDTQQLRYVRDPEFPSEPPAVRQAPFIEWDALPVDAKARYFGQARAVLQSIREPSGAMVEAGACGEFGLLLVAKWQAMIDAAINEGESE